jgi:hypothetical protein
MLSDSKRAKVDETTDAVIDQARKELGGDFRLVEIGDTATVEGLMRDLEIEERLDALIDKGLKRLLFLRVSNLSHQFLAPFWRLMRSTG